MALRGEYCVPISIVDQIYIKAWRIRQIQEKGKQKIADSIESEFIGIVNYGIIALIQLAMGDSEEIELNSRAGRKQLMKNIRERWKH